MGPQTQRESPGAVCTEGDAMIDTILQGDVRSCLKQLEDGSVQCAITSPPYWGLRSYCAEDSPEKVYEIGLEPTPEAYVADLVEVFREVKRVLRDDGVLWLVIGDSYAGSGKGGQSEEKRSENWQPTYANKGNVPVGLKPKDLVGIPWMVAFALRADGWYLRSDIIWNKPNPMPESVTDRCTKSHEDIFMLTKSERYYYDGESIKEPTITQDLTVRDRETTRLNNVPGRAHMGGLTTNNFEMRNKRDVWTVATQPCAEAHFATFPPKLIEPMILAGSKVGDTILDPFMGSGTTAIQAVRLHRHYLGCELNPEYVKMAERRIADMVGPLFEVTA